MHRPPVRVFLDVAKARPDMRLATRRAILVANTVLPSLRSNLVEAVAATSRLAAKSVATTAERELSK
jgi:hypothetical protein